MKVVDGVEDFTRLIDSTVRKIKLSKGEFNKQRAEKFRRDTIADMKTGRLGLQMIKKETALNRYQNKGGPLFDTGELARAQKIKKGEDKSREVGYWESDTEKHRRTDLTNAELAIIHHAGAKLKNGGVIPARPFMYRSADKYDKSKNDWIIAKRWLKKYVF